VSEPIRVLLVDMPRIPRELIEHALAAEPDMIVVGSTPDVDQLEPALASADPEFVIVGLENATLPPSAARAFDEQARLKMLGVEVRDGTAFLYELRPEREALGPVSPADVVTAIRDAAGPREEGG
jgi:DNA-binding NarL/FixJ family response regulator